MSVKRNVANVAADDVVFSNLIKHPSELGHSVLLARYFNVDSNKLSNKKQ